MNSHDEHGHDDDRLRWQLRGLRRDLPPTRDLWPGIAARIAETPAAAAPAPARRWLPLGLAASMLLAAGLAWQVQRPAPPPADPLIQREAEALARQYQGALDELARLPPAQVAEAYTPALRELDGSAQAILRALERDPDSRLLLDQLRRTYSKRLALSQRTTVLS
ncbi:hypothetical protein MASR1M8_02270 [Thermomonas brevis]